MWHNVSISDCLTKAKEPSLSDYLLTTGVEEMELYLFQGISVISHVQVWTRSLIWFPAKDGNTIIGLWVKLFFS